MCAGRIDRHELGVEAYLYLYPLVTMELTRRQMTNSPAGQLPGRAPMGQFAHVTEFPAADFRAVVRPNFDTLYSSAWLDLSGGPIVLSAPDTGGRYYLLPVLDMWTDAFAVPGSRTTGTGEQHHALLPPGWSGSLPRDVSAIEAPTPTVWVIGRTQANGPGDYAAVNKIQAGFTATPLARWQQRGQVPAPLPFEPDPSVDVITPPLEQVEAMTAAEFFALGARLAWTHRPHLTDFSVLARIARIGFRPGRDFSLERLDAQTRAALEEVPKSAQDLMTRTLPRLAGIVNGWQMNTRSMGVYGNEYVKRAIVTRVGLGANPPEDAIYPVLLADTDGAPLSGDHDYVCHFEARQLPPVKAFWSVTMYDGHGFQSANALNRFALGDRDPLAYNADGSLDLYLQHSSPGPGKESNWLPAPAGPVGITMRLYEPRPEALDGRWRPPPVRRVR